MVHVVDIDSINKEDLENVAVDLVQMNDMGETINFKGSTVYSRLLTENILLMYFDDFKKDPWGNFKKHFKDVANIYPILAVNHLKQRDKNKQVYLRNDAVMDNLLLGKTPEQLNMLTYESVVPLMVEKRQKVADRKRV